MLSTTCCGCSPTLRRPFAPLRRLPCWHAVASPVSCQAAAESTSAFFQLAEACNADVLAVPVATRHAGRTLAATEDTAASPLASVPLAAALAVPTFPSQAASAAAFGRYLTDCQERSALAPLPEALLAFLLDERLGQQWGEELGAMARLAALLLWAARAAGAPPVGANSSSAGSGSNGGNAGATSEGSAARLYAGMLPAFVPAGRQACLAALAAAPPGLAQRALQLEPLVLEAERQAAWAATVHDSYLSAVSGSPGRELQLSDSLEQSLWALSAVRSRSLLLAAAGGSAGAPGRSRGALTALVPVIDLANHSFDPNAEVAYDAASGSVQLRPLRPVAAGEALSIDYGCRRDNLDLMCDYGFLETSNINDAPLGLLADGKLAGAAKQLAPRALVRAARACVGPSQVRCCATFTVSPSIFPHSKAAVLYLGPALCLRLQ